MANSKQANQSAKVFIFCSLFFLIISVALNGLNLTENKFPYMVTFLAAILSLAAAIISYTKSRRLLEEEKENNDWRAIMKKVEDLQEFPTLLQQFPTQVAALRKSCQEEIDYENGHVVPGSTKEDLAKRTEKVLKLERLLRLL